MSAGRLLRPGFGKRLGIAVLGAVALALVLQVVTADGPDAVSGGVGGDYASFYAAGGLALADPGLHPRALYDPEAQFRRQAPVLPSDSEGNLFFGYPAFFVVPYVPLASIAFGASYLVHTGLMVVALVAAFRLVQPMAALVRTHSVEVLAISLTFFPLFRGVTGGQNTALSLLLVAVMWRSLHDGREAPAGIAAALLLFKPPLALPFLGALVLARHWRAALAAGMTTVALYGIGAVATGPAWPSAWVDAVQYLDRVDTPFNVQNFVSVPGAAEALLGIDSAAATIIGFGLAAVAVAIVSWVWWRGTGDLASRMALTTAGALLISPHALYYDAGLLVLVFIVLDERQPGLRRWLPVMWGVGLTHLGADALGVNPVVGLVVLAFGASLSLVRSGDGMREPDRVGA